MPASNLEISVERFNAALASLKASADRVKNTQPLSETERTTAVTRIDQAINALQRVLGDGGKNAAG